MLQPKQTSPSRVSIAGRYELSQRDAGHKQALQQSAFEARMAELTSLQGALTEERYGAPS